MQFLQKKNILNSFAVTEVHIILNQTHLVSKESIFDIWRKVYNLQDDFIIRWIQKNKICTPSSAPNILYTNNFLIQ